MFSSPPSSFSKRSTLLLTTFAFLVIVAIVVQFLNRKQALQIQATKATTATNEDNQNNVEFTLHHENSNSAPLSSSSPVKIAPGGRPELPNVAEILSLMREHDHKFPKDKILDGEDLVAAANQEKLAPGSSPPPQISSSPVSSPPQTASPAPPLFNFVPSVPEMRKNFLVMMPNLNNKNALAVNYSDPYFDSEETCNTRIGGALLPPAPCTKENPCMHVISNLNSTGWKHVDFPSFVTLGRGSEGDDDADAKRMKCAGHVCRLDVKDDDDNCPFLARGVVESIAAAKRAAPSKAHLKIIRAKKERSGTASLTPKERDLLQKQEMLEFGWLFSKQVFTQFRLINDGDFQSVEIDDAWFPEAKTRHFCSYFPETDQKHENSSTSAVNTTPSSAPATTPPPPLIIAFPASGCDAPSLAYSATNLRIFAERHKFSLVTIQPLNRHWHASGWVGSGESGQKNDDIFRNFTHNDDVKFIDKLIDTLVESGRADPKRIYLFGVSNGLMFASFYGIMRSGSVDAGGLLNNAREGDDQERARLQSLYTGKTPKGNRVAAVAGFSGGDPFKGVGWSERCQTRPAPKSDLPFFIVSRLCDIVPCKWVREWAERLVNEVGSREVRWTLLDADDKVRTTNYCSQRNREKVCEPVDDMMGHMHMPMRYLKDAIDFLLKF